MESDLRSKSYRTIAFFSYRSLDTPPWRAALGTSGLMIPLVKLGKKSVENHPIYSKFLNPFSFQRIVNFVSKCS